MFVVVAATRLGAPSQPRGAHALAYPLAHPPAQTFGVLGALAFRSYAVVTKRLVPLLSLAGFSLAGFSLAGKP